MNRPAVSGDMRTLEPVREHEADRSVGLWTRRLILFLRAMAAISMLKGLYHWAQVCGIGFGEVMPFEYHSIAWQTATIFFANCCSAAPQSAAKAAVDRSRTSKTKQRREAEQEDWFTDFKLAFGMAEL